MKKLLILALTSAFVAAANADATINWGVTTSTLTNASWNDNNAPGVVGSVFKIDADVGDGVALLPSGTAPDPQVKTVVTVEATFTAISDYSSLEQLGTDAKTALTVAKDSNDTPHYYYWNPLSSDENKWTLLGTTATPNTEQAVTVVIELDYTLVNSPKAKFKIGNTTPVEVDLSSETTLTGLAFAGTGDLTSVAATVTPAYAAKTVNNVTTRYATIADAGEGDITLYKHNGAFGELPTANDKVYYVKNESDTTADLGVFPSSGDGTAKSPYTIGDADELKSFKELVEKNYTRTSFYKLTSNIDAASIGQWDGIGVYDDSNKAFKGTLDGAGYAINNLTFAVAKYRGFFDQLEGAVSNLTINVAGFANTTAAEHGYAAFAGNMKDATIKNCIATGTIGTTAKPAMHTCGGFAVKVTSGGTFENCTNKIDIVCSLKDNPKIGGIVGLLQGATFKNCWNEGDMTITVKKCNNAGNGAGGLIGYAQNNASTITGGGNSGTIQATDTTSTSYTIDVYVGSIVGKTGAGLTVSGGTVAQADKASAGVNTNVSGLNFATVSGNVATFVADNALAAGNTYKVMASGVTATATLTAGDTISFDENLFTPTYAITAASGLVAPSTSGKVVTYTASTPVPVDSGSKEATLLVSVPQNCKASELINTSNRAAKDLLRVLNKTTNKYYQWEYDGSGGWTPNNVVQDADNVVVTPAANTVDLTRGEAVWVTRTDTNEPIKLNAVYTDDPVEVAVSTGYNLVAPALKDGETTFALSSLYVKGGSFSDTDMIVIPSANAPINCVRKDGAWKIYKAESVTDDDSWGGIATGGKYVTPDPIPAGKGFFFVTKEAKTLSL